MFKFRFASEPEISERKRLTLDFLGEPESSRSPLRVAPKREPALPSELRAYLQFVADTPGLSITQREEKAGIYARKGKAIREELAKRGLIVETEVRKGVGRPVKDVRLTEKACQIIGRQSETGT